MSKILVKTTFYVSVHKGLGHYFFIYCTVVVFLEKLDKDYFFLFLLEKITLKNGGIPLIEFMNFIE